MTPITPTSPRPLAEAATRLAEHAAQGTDRAIKSTQRAANQVLDGLSGAVQQMPAAVLEGAARAEVSTRRGIAALRDRTEAASAYTRGAIEHDPLRSVVIAAAVGAGLTALWWWLSRRPAAR